MNCCYNKGFKHLTALPQCKHFYLFLIKHAQLKKLVLLSILCCTLAASFAQTGNYWQQKVNYKIDVSLDDVKNTLDGFVKMEYYNNSPDTLNFIWFHLWQNAYKNDRTAFSDQLLEHSRTDFYFSDNNKKGYINRLDFKVNGMVATMEDHPVHQDIIKLLLPQPLPPGAKANIQTPFHELLAFNFSRGGHVGQAYQITQWYPKPAVYDRKGWHPMPYLDQGEFYSEFGDYEVQITLPQNYVVAATGNLQDEEEIKWLKEKAAMRLVYEAPVAKKSIPSKRRKDTESVFPASSAKLKTIHYVQQNVHDFAWFADKRFAVRQDTLQLPSGRIVQVAAYFIDRPTDNIVWKNSTAFIKQAVLTRSKFLGEYPYNNVSALEAEMGFGGGMEYPTITSISPTATAGELEGTIEHEVGHNWNYGVLATNEREHPWMDEGINRYYDYRYNQGNFNIVSPKPVKEDFFHSRLPTNFEAIGLRIFASQKKDQPIETPAADFSELNYQLIAYYKTAQWMKLLENSLGRDLFDSSMHEYFRRWKFKHPYPEDFKRVVEDVSNRNLDSVFSLLNKKGLFETPERKPLRFATFFNFRKTGNYHYIFLAPAAGYNLYDKIMLGGIIHNYRMPPEKFQFFAAPLYATGSKQLNGIGRMSYTFFPGNKGQKLQFALAGESFSADSYTDSAGNKTFLRFSKIVPAIKFIFANKNPRSHLTRFIQWKTFFVTEQGLLFKTDPVTMEENITYPFANRYVNQLLYVMENVRVLYPYRASIKMEQGKDFARLALAGNYYFNYAKEGGMNVRVFAGKFFYLGDRTYLKQFETDRYHINMTGPKGYEDYTYSNYFIGRNEFEKFSSQQIMERDGFFKVRTDLLSSKIGKTDNWLAAANFTTDIPNSINPLQVLPVKIPLKVFVDVGTYAEAWQQNSGTGKVIYDAGLQVSLFANTVNIYFPILYSKVYRDYFKSTITEKRFLKNISFSIDIQHINLRRWFPQIPF